VNQKTVKKLKKIIGYQPESPEMKRHLNRLKIQYSQLSHEAKPLFIASLKKMYEID